MRIIIMAVAALLAFAGAIQAQVAAPRLNPIAIESTAPIFSPHPSNPATLPWSGPSRIGGGLLDLEEEDATGTQTLEGDGKMLQARWVGEMFAVNAEVLNSDFEDVPPPGTFDFDAFLIGAAFQWGEVFSIGVGFESEELSDATVSLQETLPVAGATLRLAEVIYLGVATGEATLEESVPTFTEELDRTVTRLGVAYLWREDDRGLHLEIYREERDSEQSITLEAFGKDSDGFTVEVVFSNILIGYESISTESTNFAGVDLGEDEETIISVGWAPGQGLALVASKSEIESTDAAGIPTDTLDSLFIGVAWLF